MTPPVLIIHGALGSAPQLEPVRAAFENQGLTVHSLNLSGHGGVQRFSLNSELNSLQQTYGSGWIRIHSAP